MAKYGRLSPLAFVTRTTVVVALLSLLAAFLTAGCEQSASRTAGSKESGTGEQGVEKAEKTASQRQEETQAGILDNVRGSLDLNRLDFSTDLQIIISMLNQWRNASGQPPETLAIPKRVESLIGKDAIPLFNSQQYTPVDGMFLRDCVLTRAVSRYAAGDARDDLSRVLNLFQYVTRSIRVANNHLGWLQLPGNQKIDVPFTQYDTCLLGFGTAHDRAWVFSSLLRQNGIDSVILYPEVPPEEVKRGADYFLVGVLIDKEVYLFDPFMGVAIPAPAGKDATAGRPATLRQVVSSTPDLFRQLDPIPKIVYPLRAAQFKRPRAQLIGSLSLWSARMKRLQAQFTGRESMVIFEALGDLPNQPGAFTRVGAAGGEFWNADSLELWSYPHQMLFSAMRLQPGQLQILTRLYLPMNAPIDWTITAGTPQIQLLPPKRLEQQARLAHLNGGFGSASKLYLDVRMGARKDPRVEAPQGLPIVMKQGNEMIQDASQIMRIVFDRSNDDATYFTGLCQVDRGDYRAAAETFQKYLEYYARTRHQAEQAIQQRAIQEGKPEPAPEVKQNLLQVIAFRFFWINSVRFNLGLCQAKLGDKAQAAKTLRTIPTTNSQFAGYLQHMQQLDPKIAAEVRQEMQTRLDEALKKLTEQAKPKSDEKPAASSGDASKSSDKPGDAAPAKSPPTETKAAELSKPADKPAGDTKPAAKPADTKSAEPKSETPKAEVKTEAKAEKTTPLAKANPDSKTAAPEKK